MALRLEHQPDELYEHVARALGLSVSAAHRSVQRLQLAGLLLPGSRRVNRSALLEFLVHGARYAFPAHLGADVRGVPTAGAFPPIREELPEGNEAVWPSADGRNRGPSLTPLYAAAPKAALRDQRLHHLLALVDVCRIGQARERKLGEAMLRKLLMVV